MLGREVSACFPDQMKRRSFITSLIALCLPLPKKAFNPERFRLRGPTVSGVGAKLLQDLGFRVNLAEIDSATWAKINSAIERGDLQFGLATL